MNRTTEMVSFELGKEIEKDVFRLVMSMTNTTPSTLLILAVCRTCHMNFIIDLAHHGVSLAQ